MMRQPPQTYQQVSGQNMSGRIQGDYSGYPSGQGQFYQGTNYWTQPGHEQYGQPSLQPNYYQNVYAQQYGSPYSQNQYYQGAYEGYSHGTSHYDAEYNQSYASQGQCQEPYYDQVNAGSASQSEAQEQPEIKAELDPNQLSNEGKVAFKAGLIRPALACFISILKHDVNNVEALNYLGRIYEKLERPDNALESYDRGLKVDPKNLAILYQKKEFLIRQQTASKERQEDDTDIIKAIIDHYTNWLQYHSQENKIIFDRGKLYFELKQYNDALRDFLAYHDLAQSADIDIYKYLGLTYSHLAQQSTEISNNRYYDLALEFLNRALQSKPDEVNLYLERGHINRIFLRYENAISDYSEVVNRRPTNDASCYWRGYCYSRIGSYESALNDFAEVLCINPSHHAVLGEKGIALFHQQKYENALEYFDKYLSDSNCQNDSTILLYKAKTLGVLKKYKEAVNIYKILIEKESNNPEVWAGYGFALFQKKHYKTALSSFETAIKLYTSSQLNEADKKRFHNVILYKADVLYALKRTRDAIEGYKAYLGLNPNSFYALSKCAELYKDLGDFDQAVDYFQKCTKFYFKDLDTVRIFELYVNFGDCLKAQARYEDALDKYNKAKKYRANDLILLDRIRELNHYLNNEAEGKKSKTNIYDRAHEKDKDPDAKILYKMGLRYLNESNYQEAGVFLLRAADKNHAGALYNLGMMCENGQGFSKNLTKAKSYYSQAARLGHEDAKNHLQFLEEPVRARESSVSKPTENDTKANAFTVINKDEIETVDFLGSGAAGKVFKGKWRGAFVALKKLDVEMSRWDPKILDEYEKEAKLMQQNPHPNVVQVFGICKSDNEYTIVMQFMEGGSLDKVLREKKDLFWRSELWEILQNIVAGLQHLHKNNIIHRDLKTGNVFVDRHYQSAKLGDFGVSKITEDDAEKSNTKAIGSPCYMAPEVLDGVHYSKKIDIYSLGILIWVLLTKTEPWRGVKLYFIPAKVLKGERPEIPPNCPKKYNDLMQECWHQDPNKRPTIEEVVQKLEAFTEQDKADLDQKEPLGVSKKHESKSRSPDQEKNGKSRDRKDSVKKHRHSKHRAKKEAAAEKGQPHSPAYFGHTPVIPKTTEQQDAELKGPAVADDDDHMLNLSICGVTSGFFVDSSFINSDPQIENDSSTPSPSLH